jgi:hypothetical protein
VGLSAGRSRSAISVTIQIREERRTHARESELRATHLAIANPAPPAGRHEDYKLFDDRRGSPAACGLQEIYRCGDYAAIEFQLFHAGR